MQAIDRKEAQQYLNKFSFQPFFTELMGWNATPATRTIKTVERQDFHFTAIAEKRGYTVLLCDALPAYPVRAKLDRLISRDHFEHIIVFTDQQAKRQIWQVSLREKGQPVKLREVTFKVGTSSGEELIQKLEQIAVPLALDESIHLTDLTQAARAAFNREKVTKSFFKQFELEHKSFLKFLKGVPKTTEAWYVSVLINRLMFLYFMQSKSFLDGNPTYLTDKLKASTARKKDTFYRDFLCPLFFEGFALKKGFRTPAVKGMLGDIPYLNGGLFQKHAIELQAEQDGTPIVIPDAAFQQLFAFFDKWTWHLDPDENATGDEIDPDVLGYIFEKYINQKQMGAYYTKEDITGYIAQNTVLPFLFDTARKGCANAFLPDGAIWRMLRDDPDVYIYPAMRRGNARPTRLELPPEIAAGLDNVALRTGWNSPIPAEFADAVLPTETWREFIARRRRYDDLCTRIAAGEVHQVNDLITLNLDIRQLALDAIQIAGSEDLVESLYNAIESVTILDPTCGSGAFLFAALELLQPLYQACLIRMQEFVHEAKTDAASKGKELHFNRFAHFRKTLDAAAKHVNTDYFILKTIIVQNLYGVDIMEEATEICKLRLFLKLVAQVDAKQKDKIEPLPDIDFNIRAGNTLVGYARYDDVKKAAGSNLFDAEEAMSRIDDRLQTIDAAAAQFRRQQTELGGSVSAEDKQVLTILYKDLEAELDNFLAAEYGVKEDGLVEWKQGTKPFHWFCDFHAILHRGGFNVIIGNPPYITFPSPKVAYSFLSGAFVTDTSKNLYAVTFERSLQLLSTSGYCGLIVQLTAISSGRMKVLQEQTSRNRCLLALPFPRRPESMFDGVEMPVVILQIGPQSEHEYATTRVNRIYGSERSTVMEQLAIHRHRIRVHGHRIAKLGSTLETNILEKLQAHLPQSLGASVQAAGSPHQVYYQEACRYWAKVTLGVPRFLKNGVAMQPSHGRMLGFSSAASAGLATCILNSNTFYWYYSTLSDCEHINDDLVRSFPIPSSLAHPDWKNRALSLTKAIGSSSIPKSINTKQGHVIEYDEITASKHKSEIDEIDRVLAKHYGFTDEELDFIINYDIKYRMGPDATGPDADA